MYKSKTVKPIPITIRTVVNEVFGIRELNPPLSPSPSPASPSPASRFNSLFSTPSLFLLCFLGSFVLPAVFVDVFVVDSGLVICSFSVEWGEYVLNFGRHFIKNK